MRCSKPSSGDDFCSTNASPLGNVGGLYMPAARPGPDSTIAARDARRLSTLLAVSQALSGTLNLKAALQRVLATLIRQHSVTRGMVMLLRDGELHVEAVEGFEDR